MSNHFTCSVCGKRHGHLVSDWAAKLPDAVWALREDERAETARFDNDLCKMGDRYFIRGVLEVPLNENTGRFGWGVWAEVDARVFRRYIEIFSEDGTMEPAQDGFLANDLARYGGHLGAPIVIRFRDPATRPSFHFQPADQSQLAVEQRSGISAARHRQLVSQLQTP